LLVVFKWLYKYFKEALLMAKLLSSLIGFGCALLLSVPAFAVVVSWTDWNTTQDAFSASGDLQVDLTTVTVDYSGTGSHNFVQTTAGANWWTEGDPAPYTGGIVDNAPPADFGIVALNTGGTVTVNFSETIVDPFIGLVSWNGNVVDFGVTIELISEGAGFWGNGAFTSVTSTGFTGSGELHGIIRLAGSYDSISFTHTSENWHGFTVGVAGLDEPTCGVPGTPPCEPSVPTPGTLALFGIGLLGLLLRRITRK